MNIKDVMASSHRILDKVNKHTDEVLAQAPQDKQEVLRGMMSYLALQASLTEDEEDLLHIADVLHNLVSDIPGMLQNGYQLGGFQLTTLSPVSPTMGSFVDSEKQRLEKSLNQAFSKLDQKVVLPNPPENVVQFTDNPQPWRWAGAFKDDPTWDQLLEDIEQQRDMHLV